MIKLDKNKNYLLACSFGPDSMALFDMLKKEGYHFSAALVNYHIRKESTDEMNSFIAYCNQVGVSYHIKDLIRGVGDVNVEAECRKIRYAFFAELSAQFLYDAVLVAHNQDDLIETYLLQKNRQNLPKHYGIQEKTIINNTVILRPLLSYSKKSLLDYCLTNDVPFAIDSTNLEDKYLRNKIRHNIVEKMNKEDRNEIIQEINDKNNEVQAIFGKLQSLDLHDVNILKNLEINELAYAIHLMAENSGYQIAVSMRQVKQIRLILNSSNGNISIPINAGFVFRRSYDKVDVVQPRLISYSYTLNGPAELDTEYFYLNFLGDTSNRNVKENDYPLTIRNFHNGDQYVIKNYVVNVRRLFIDWKMPLVLREKWPLIVNKDGKVIYIPRYQKDFKPSKDTNFYVK